MDNNKFPDIFYQTIKNQYNNYEDIINGSTEKCISLRVNMIKSSKEEVTAVLNQNNIKFKKADFSVFDDIYYIENENINTIKNTEIYKQGKIYLQSLSSCLPVLLLNPKENEDILDMAASPGGKTTQIASLTAGKANITACERHPIRIEKLKHNLTLQGVKNVNIINKDARQLEDWFKFDKILLDAPCSGSGTLLNTDKNNNIHFTKQLIDKCTKTQSGLLAKAVKLLKKGGILVYSTCSVLKQENEDMICKYINNGSLEPVFIDNKFKENLPLLKSKYDEVLTVCPTKLYEGFFVAMLRKK